MDKKTLKVTKENQTGLNVEFVNTNTNRTIPLTQVVAQIEKGNPSYSDYHVVQMKNGVKYVRSDPDSSCKNNIE